MLKKLSTKDSKSNTQVNPRVNGVAGLIGGIFLAAAIIGAAIMDNMKVPSNTIGIYVVATTLVGAYFLFALKIASQWEKAVVLRFGRFRHLAGPGLFWIVPIMDTIPNWIDHR
jgi:regulator of protease activity HflC (stomatin/prohibitin superfamily)